MKRILLRSFKSPFTSITPEMTLQQRVWSGNFGNFVFSDSVHKMLLTEGREISLINEHHVNRESAETLAGRINEEYDILVLPFANAFRLEYLPHLKKWTQLIRRLRIPVVVIGIGAQSTLEYEFEPLSPLDNAVRDFCDAVLEHSPSIGVRGQFTHDYLAHLGISDVDVIGCPSMFRYGNQLGVEKKQPTLDAESRIAASFTQTKVGDIASIFQANFERYPNLHYIAQDLKDLEVMYWGDTSVAAQLESDQPGHVSHKVFQENRARLFLDPATWITTLGQYDFAFGTRIHGNITALLGGTPSVVLTHDSRTRELSEYFEIPHSRLNDLPSDVDAAGLYEEADFSALVNGHQKRFERITGFLAKHRLSHVYLDGEDHGTAFEDRMAEIRFAAPVEAWLGGSDESGFRTAWLYANVVRGKQNLAAATKRVAALEETVASLEKTIQLLQAERKAERERATKTPYRRVRRAIGKQVKRHSK